MFSGALKSFSSHIGNAYTISPQPSSTAGPWRIFDAKRKTTGKAASVFVFDRKALEGPSGGLGGRTSGTSLKRVHEEVVERLKKEASSLARLRHPSILELAEPVEETRNGGLMFATEPVTASLAGLLQEKDEQERSGGVGGRGSRYVVEESDGTRRRRELEIDELEIQKGLLQLGKGLEFLHESAGLVHANLTPEAVFVNAKGDWKISGLGFCGPHDHSTAATSLTPILLSEVLNHDPRLPPSVQLNLDYTSPDFVLDNNLNPAADIFSLGVLIIALYNSPHTSPLHAAGSLSTYKRAFSSSSSIPTANNNFLVPSSNPLPTKLVSELLPRLITRRPAQRLSAREFQEASYFDNILVSTIRFLDALPAKTMNEKAQFMRGLPRITPQFPRSVLEKKVLPALLDEMKDRELLAPIMSNIFTMIKAMPSGKRVFTERVVPRFREIFITNRSGEKDTSTESGLMIFLENMETTAANCPGKEFHDDILPILLLAMDSSTHAIIDTALGTLPFVLPVLDYATTKNEVFPVIAHVFSKTSSLTIKVRGLEAFYTLCGGSKKTDNDDSMLATEKKSASASNSAILDKFTIQEKVVPLLKGIKTKEPGVMIAALHVFEQVGEVGDSDFLAMEVLPNLWSMSLGPLLNLQQFQSFMSLIKTLGGKIEKEQTKKLQELGSTGGGSAGLGARGGRRGYPGANGFENGEETDFETLVSGRKAADPNGNDLMNQWGVSQQPLQPTGPRSQGLPQAANNQPAFAWQSLTSTQQTNALRAQVPATRTITPDQSLSAFASLTPATQSNQQFQQPPQFSQPLQPPSQPSAATSTLSNMPMRPAQQPSTFQAPSSTGTSIDWSASGGSSASAWSNNRPQNAIMNAPMNGFGATAQTPTSSFSIPPPPMSPSNMGRFNSPLSSPPLGGGATQFSFPPSQPSQPAKKTGLDQYESLL